MLNYKYTVYVVYCQIMFVHNTLNNVKLHCSSNVWEITAMMHLIDPKFTFVILQKISISNTFCSFKRSSFYSSKNPAKNVSFQQKY